MDNRLLSGIKDAAALAKLNPKVHSSSLEVESHLFQQRAGNAI